MYPAQTSFIPVQVALARFFETEGLKAISSNYPYWYLGSTPFRYLTGPVLPVLANALHKILPTFSLFEIVLGTVGLSWIAGGVGVYWLMKTVGGKGTNKHRLTAFLAAFCYLFGPIVPFLFRFSSGEQLVAFSFLPFVLVLYSQFLRKYKQRLAIYCILAITFLMLISTAILPTLILGMVIVFLATTGWKRAEEKIKQTVFILILALLIATCWYSPGYWWQLLIAPSFAGKPLFRVVGQLAQLLPAALAIGLAVASGQIIKSKDRVLKFCFYWLFIFGFLTLIRFISDPDFWLDWSAYSQELQLGLALFGGLLLFRISGLRMGANEKRIYANIRLGMLLGVVGVFWLFLANQYVLGTLQRNITETVEYRISSQLAKMVRPNERVFLSGSTAFWLNAFSASWRIPQVRGGKDEVSVNQDWRKATWEIRDGSTGSPQKVEKSVQWLKDLEVTYLVVHTQDSEEFYHDFVSPEKLEGAEGLKKVYDEKGDRIYKVLD